jgi:hypothetical protein
MLSTLKRMMEAPRCKQHMQGHTNREQIRFCRLDHAIHPRNRLRFNDTVIRRLLTAIWDQIFRLRYSTNIWWYQTLNTIIREKIDMFFLNFDVGKLVGAIILGLTQVWHNHSIFNFCAWLHLPCFHLFGTTNHLHRHSLNFIPLSVNPRIPFFLL